MKQLIAIFLLVAGAGAARAQSVDQPLLLIAAPALQGLYSRTALLVVPVAQGHVGFIVNRETRTKLGTLFPAHEPSAKVEEPVRLGGPELIDAVFAVVPEDPGGRAMPLFGGAYLVADASEVDRVIEQQPDEARFFVGFVGWRAGELAAEIEAGYWYVDQNPDAALFFRPDTEGLWRDQLRRLAEFRTARRAPRGAPPRS